MMTPTKLEPQRVQALEVDVFQLVPKANEMDPEERANFFTLVDQLEPEKINDAPVSDPNKIPMSLTEIFEISNANRRQNKRRKKQ